MIINRVWAMPSRWTFTIKPIKMLLEEEMNGGIWLDAFAGMNSPAQIRNDLNLKMNAQYHMDAKEFLMIQEDNSVDGVLFDPPYSFYELLRCYKGIGRERFKWGEFNTFWFRCKDEIARIIKPKGKSICFGWNSVGMGKKRDFELKRILLVCHGGVRNDTICTVEVKL